jgi:hypothetical protein
VLDHVEREVVEAAKAPDGQSQQYGYSRCGVLEKQQPCRQQTQEQKQHSLYPYPSWTSQISHRDLLRACRAIFVLVMRTDSICQDRQETAQTIPERKNCSHGES